MTKRVGGTITLRHVAERSGVSITTVSRILNGDETGVPVRPETRERICRPPPTSATSRTSSPGRCAGAAARCSA